MSFAREKRLLLAALAAVAPLPLPFNRVITWVAVLIFWAALALFAYRAAADAQRWLSGWAMNALALLYLPFFFGDLTLFWRGQVLQALAHLALFTLTVMLFALKR
ncbi:MAG: hypothetical protein R3325_13850, partial [Thermoanaerobaculia bacterium]|nr:hypothetical protein [Thermoanaerobaculia bacterium]